jgi:hypothetical protein
VLGTALHTAKSAVKTVDMQSFSKRITVGWNVVGVTGPPRLQSIKRFELPRCTTSDAVLPLDKYTGALMKSFHNHIPKHTINESRIMYGQSWSFWYEAIA